MIIRIVKLNIKPSEIKNFKDIFNLNKNKILGFKGCIDVNLLQEKRNESIFFTYSKWESLNSIEDYRNSDIFKSIWSSVKPFFNEKAQAWSLDQINHIQKP
ncbi:MAG: antibiotic biosynthesis monooxygenase [Flavobacteriales bacterium]|jgi:(4S)-4-hydroxy-5-phosphonooxypentane-2,3-dione isomerase|nr:antibiotic biosynthesis monooxygenase [Flavobacteriales bacterium]